MEFSDIIYEKKEGIAKVLINRPDKFNAFRELTMAEMVAAMTDAWADKEVGVVIFGGTGNKAFCTGGDLSTKDETGYGQQGASLDLQDNYTQLLHLIRSIPKPVIAKVNGYAIGGGHVLQVVCDLSIASETARLGQVGPKVGSFDAGFGTIFLARIVGERKAREIWYMCRQYSAQEAFEMGLVNAVVPPEDLDAEVEKWGREILEKAPGSLAYLKASFNSDTDHAYGGHNTALQALRLYYATPESHEGLNAFMEKRKPDFSKFRK